jgi:hypothetical protein
MRSVEQEILVGRGRILDRNGQLLALDLPVKNVIVEPKVVLSNGQAKAVSAHLARVLELPYDQVFARVNKPGDPYEPWPRLVREEVAEKVMRLRLPGRLFRAADHPLLSAWKFGLPRAGLFQLGGRGQRRHRAALGFPAQGPPRPPAERADGVRREIYTRRSLEVDPQEGADIHLTLDQNIQYFVEKALDAAMTNFHPEAAWAIVQDVRTGAILGMASRPAYDLNHFSKTDARHAAEPAVGVNFEPGSVFKIGVVAAALNEGLVGTNDVFDCENGMWFYAGRPLKDFHPYGESRRDGHPAQVQQHRRGEDRRDARGGAAAPLSEGLRPRNAHGPRSARRGGRHAASVSKWAKIDITRVAMGHDRGGDRAADAERAVLHRQRRLPDEAHLVRKVVDKNGVVLQEKQARGRGPAHHRAHGRADAADAHGGHARRRHRHPRRRGGLQPSPARPAAPRRSSMGAM